MQRKTFKRTWGHSQCKLSGCLFTLEYRTSRVGLHIIFSHLIVPAEQIDGRDVKIVGNDIPLSPLSRRIEGEASILKDLPPVIAASR